MNQQFKWWMVPVVFIAVIVGLLVFCFMGSLMSEDLQATCPEDEFKAE
jgi:hypothetical protein